MTPTIKKEKGFQYIEEGQGEVLLLLHGLLGTVGDWKATVAHFSQQYRVIIPRLPIYELPIKESNIEGLLKFVTKFVEAHKLPPFTLIGNSLGGQLALLYALQNPRQVQRLVLTGSAGLLENTFRGSYLKRNSYAYVAERIGYTFFDPQTVDKAYVDEIFSITTTLSKAIRVASVAKSTQRHNLAHELPKVKQATLLIWGLNDTITPPTVAHEFNAFLPNSQLCFIDQCCHAPMMEHPHKFNILLDRFLQATA